MPLDEEGREMLTELTDVGISDPEEMRIRMTKRAELVQRLLLMTHSDLVARDMVIDECIRRGLPPSGDSIGQVMAEGLRVLARLVESVGRRTG